MCLYVLDKPRPKPDKLYTFWKVYDKVNITKRTPYGLVSPYRGSVVKGPKLVAKLQNGYSMPESGEEAMGRYGHGSVLGSLRVEEGIHAYTSKRKASFYSCDMSDQVIIKVQVYGRHIMAFGQYEDVAFTRGTLVLDELK